MRWSTNTGEFFDDAVLPRLRDYRKAKNASDIPLMGRRFIDACVAIDSIADWIARESGGAKIGVPKGSNSAKEVRQFLRGLSSHLDVITSISIHHKHAQKVSDPTINAVTISNAPIVLTGFAGTSPACSEPACGSSTGLRIVYTDRKAITHSILDNDLLVLGCEVFERHTDGILAKLGYRPASFARTALSS